MTDCAQRRNPPPSNSSAALADATRTVNALRRHLKALEKEHARPGGGTSELKGIELWPCNGRSRQTRGFIGEVPTGRYPAFPATPLKRLRWAMEAPIKSPAGKVVLIVLAFHADDTGRAWPAIETIAAEASIGRRTAFRAIDGLERRRWIATYQRRGRSTIYWPKRPCDLLCRGCWTMLPSGTTDCPVCGIEAGKGVPERHRGVPERHP